jgi:hypothetical protein
MRQASHHREKTDVNGRRIDSLSRVLAARGTRRAALRQGGALALGAGVFGATGKARAMARHQETTEERPEVPADAPCVIPFNAAVRQGPNAGTSFLGYLALITEESGKTTGAFITDDEQTLGVSGQLDGQAVNLIFTTADDQAIFGVGTSAVDLGMCHGAFYTPMGGPLVGPGEGDLGDWAVITNYDGVLDGTVTVANGSIGATALARRSPMCRSCVQLCKTTPGITDIDLCAAFCGPLFGGPCTCNDPGFDICP